LQLFILQLRQGNQEGRHTGAPSSQTGTGTQGHLPVKQTPGTQGHLSDKQVSAPVSQTGIGTYQSNRYRHLLVKQVSAPISQQASAPISQTGIGTKGHLPVKQWHQPVKQVHTRIPKSQTETSANQLVDRDTWQSNVGLLENLHVS
jgi:hypothetical protein